jgi:hypothetical protein
MFTAFLSVLCVDKSPHDFKRVFVGATVGMQESVAKGSEVLCAARRAVHALAVRGMDELARLKRGEHGVREQHQGT